MSMLGLVTPPPPQKANPQTEQSQQSAQQESSDETVKRITTASDQFSAPDTDTLAISARDATARILDTTTALADTVTADTIIVETKLFTVALSTLGGGPVSIKLKDYNYAYGDKEPIEMIVDNQKAEPQISFSDGAFNLSDVSYTASTSARSVDAQSSPQSVTFSYTSPNGGVIERRYTFYPDKYSYDLHTIIPDRQTFGFDRNYDVIWGTGLKATEEDQHGDYNSGFAMALFPGGPTKFGSTGLPFFGNDWEDGKFNITEADDVKWIGIRTKYFTSILIPRSAVGERAISYGYETKEKDSFGKPVQRKHILAGFEMPIKASEKGINDSITVYVGPMDWARMDAYDVDLQEIFDIGTTPFVGWLIRIFAIPIIWLLPHMYQIIPNYGFVIILLGILVKLVVWPLSRKSVRSMAAMKELQPQLEALKEKHKSNPQALQKATMALYKEAGVNPIASCLPMLMQMPLLLALYRVFYTTILFRGAPFILWWQDLSRGSHGWIDPYMILVVVMVGFQFAQQKVSMADQKNKAMMYMMPLVFGLMFRTVASGLVLYWTTFNAFSFFEQLVGNRNRMRENAQIKGAPAVTNVSATKSSSKKKKKARKG